MMMLEFTERTGIEPTAEEYAMIEEMYYEFDGDKNAFCKYFVEKNMMLEVLREIVVAVREKNEDLRKDILCVDKELHTAKNRIAKLETELEREQEWKPYEDETNVRQADYERLDADGSRRELTDNEATDMIAEEFGFERSRITIIHEVPKYEINRHNQLRKVGTYQRNPLFDVWDWNYIRFNVRGNVTMSYEMYKGELQLFRG